MHRSLCSAVAVNFSTLQNQPHFIRNVCIMAHVDHGKTTLADALVASNGIISQKMAGKLRYLDSRKDEQERGITMKSSAIALRFSQDNVNYLVNLIDSPGHVDFTGEVSSAIHLCDGAIILVDVVEGVCAQTKLAIRQAWTRGVKMILVLNKLDRLITELKLAPLDAYFNLQQILEQVNAVVGELFFSEVLGKTSDSSKIESIPGTPTRYYMGHQVYDWSSGLDETDDSNLYFSPDQGNVIFASGIDGWGFRVHHFARMYAEKLGIKEDILLKTLWGDFYLNTKTKRIMKGAQSKAKKPLFAQFILENIWAVYVAVLERRDKEMTDKIVKSLNINITARDARLVDVRGQLQFILNQWLPLASAVLQMVCEKLPSPAEITEERVEKLINTKSHNFHLLPAESQNLKNAICKCSSSDEDPVILFVSKMISVEKSSLPSQKPRLLTAEEMAARHEAARQRHLQRDIERQCKNSESTTDVQCMLSDADVPSVTSTHPQDEHIFIAFARVFSGTIRKGQQLYVLGPKHDPAQAMLKCAQGMTVNPTLTVNDLNSNEHITVCTIKELYIFMGRELISVPEVPAGNILGIGQLEDHILKTATISSSVACPPLTDLSTHTEPILRVAVEPVHPGDMPALIHGLKLLNQADASVRVLIQETGEHVVLTAGEVHLQRCLDDLKERFAKIEINVSTPIVPFRETIIHPPKLDMVNEAIEEKISSLKCSAEEEKCGGTKSIEMKTSNKLSTIKIRATPLPESVVQLLDEYLDTIKAFNKFITLARKRTSTEHIHGGDETIKSTNDLKTKLTEVFEDAGKDWENATDDIWSFGPRKCGPNILLCRVPGFRCHSFWNTVAVSENTFQSSVLYEYANSFVSGFQLASNAGPLCEEPMRGVCFIVEDWTIEANAVAEPFTRATELTVEPNECAVSTFSDSDSVASRDDLRTPYGPFFGQIISTVREACRRAFQAQPQRLMTAMYSCNIQVTAEVLGKMYAVLGKRHGRVLHGDLQEGSAMFNVTAVLPVIESFNFANEIRRQTSGQAIPQLTFTHWEVVETDPFWVPTTEEEYLLYGEKADSENRARKYMNTVRKRKGLAIDEKIVEHAEKQRTLTKKK